MFIYQKQNTEHNFQKNIHKKFRSKCFLRLQKLSFRYQVSFQNRWSCCTDQRIYFYLKGKIKMTYFQLRFHNMNPTGVLEQEIIFCRNNDPPFQRRALYTIVLQRSHVCLYFLCCNYGTFPKIKFEFKFNSSTKASAAFANK